MKGTIWMGGKVSWTGVALVAWAVAVCGCRSPSDGHAHSSQADYQALITQIEYPDACVTHYPGLDEMPSPQTARSSGPVEYWPMTLEEAVRAALSNSRVMRDIGGMIVSTPATAVTVYDPAVRETDPRNGVEAALSAFDAQFGASLMWGNKDPFFGGLAPLPEKTQYGIYGFEIDKTAATGTQISLSNRTLFARHDPLFRLLVPRFSTAVVAGTIRQPLLQGAGIQFNRIAGPKSAPGVYNGVLIARTNTDISLADFEASVRDLVNNVERAYWDLYAAYREVDARITGRDAALETWRTVERKFRSGTSDLEQEARAREQFYALDSQVINSLSGLSVSGPTGQPAAGGGVYALERRLRWQLGLPASDGRLIRPSEEPLTAPIVFDWSESLRDSLVRRVELRRQRWVIKRREMELVAAKNFTLMRLDAMAEYGVRGFDANLAVLGNTIDLFNGFNQEWQLGLQMNVPIGSHLGHTAVHNAQYQLARERAIYREQELRISHEVSDAMVELDRAYAAIRSLVNVRLAAQQQLSEIRKKYEAGWSPLEFLLDAQRRTVEADSTYYRSLVDHTLAVAAMHRARGSLLEYYGVCLSEGPSSEEARCSAAREAERFRPRHLNYCFEVPAPIAEGVCPECTAQTPPPRPVGDSSAPPNGHAMPPRPDAAPPPPRPGSEPSMPPENIPPPLPQSRVLPLPSDLPQAAPATESPGGAPKNDRQ